MDAEDERTTQTRSAERADRRTAGSVAGIALAGNPPTDPADVITVLREQINALDIGITRLVAERVRLSQRIQTARVSAGGTRVELSRERVVLDGYRAALGPDGPGVGEAVLRVCRGIR
ncbi:MAG: chorismate mutase [Actinomycetia bacterium]|nr:chorismate mutase [Actinomycetes bacterium]